MQPGSTTSTQSDLFWHTAQPIAPSDKPAAAIIARTLTRQHPATTGQQR